MKTPRPRIINHIAVVAALCLGLLLALPLWAQAQTTEEPGILTVEVLASTAVSGTADLFSNISFNTVIDINGSRHTTFENSGAFNTGLVMINQDTGVGSNQSNVRVLALTDRAPEGAHIEEAMLSASIVSRDNRVLTIGGSRSNTISDSFEGAVGVAGINQASGLLNDETNAFVMTAGLGLSTESGGLEVLSAKALQLAVVKENNEVDPESAPGPRSDVLTNSFAGFKGFAQVNQASGNLNSLFNGISLSVSTIEVR